MTVVLWVIQILLAVVFAEAGRMKLTSSRQALLENPMMGWVDDVPWALVKVVAACEVLAAVALVVPPLLDVAEVLTPLAATGLAIVMAGAIVIHGRRGERQPMAMNAGLLALSAFVAWGRFGPYAF